MKKYYFSVASFLILILSVLGFSDNLFSDIGQESNADPKYVIHGILCLTWMIIFVVQSNFIRKGDFSTHKKLGITGMLIGVGVMLSTFYIFIVTYPGWSQLTFFAKANRFFMTSFAVLLFISYAKRNDFIQHKRLILLATLYMLEPILSRSSDHLGMDAFTAVPLIWNIFFISFLVYDWLTLRRIHPITYLGFIWFYLVWTVSILI